MALKTPDYMIIPLMEEGLNDYQIAKKFGRPAGSMWSQLKRLRQETGIPSIGDGKAFAGKIQKREISQEGVKVEHWSKEEIWAKYGKPGEDAIEIKKTEADMYTRDKIGRFKEMDVRRRLKKA